VITWLTRKFSRDPGQMGLFDLLSPAPLRRPPEPAVAPGAERLLRDEDDADDAVRSDSVRDAQSRCESGAPSPRATAPTPTVPPDAAAFLHVLRAHGLRGVDRVVFTRNRRTMVSVASGVLRVHEGFAVAPTDIHAAIAIFATSRNRAKRVAARDVIVTYPVPIRPATRRPAEQHPDDVPMAARLTTLHAQLNLEHFSGALAHLDIQVSRRLARRLGHYTPRSHTGIGVGEIVISRRHVRRDGWPEAIHTLLHEMVHQWQDETGRPVDHGSGFRAKCRAVGIEPAATRMMVR
jgi:hypothetical protein